MESLNNATKNSTVQDSLNKFESTINQMVENAPNFAEKVKSVKTPEYQGIVLEFGEFIKNVIDELAYKMKGVEVSAYVLISKKNLVSNKNICSLYF